MPLPRFDKLPRERRRTILDAAAREFAEHGFEGSSFNRIIRAAGVSKGAMYYYFADKADAYRAVLDDVLDRVEEVLIADAPTPRDAEGFWRALAEGAERLNAAYFADPQLGALSRGLYSSPESDGIERLTARTRRWVRDLLSLGQRVGAVRDDLPLDGLTEAVTGMYTAVDRWAASLPLEEERALMELTPKFLQLTRDMLERRPGRG